MTTFTLVIGNKNYSSWSLRPWLAMKHFGVAFEEVRLALYTPDTPQLLTQYSPSGKVPVLLHGSTAIWESLAILEYLAEQFPQQPWCPVDSTARAIARAVSAEMHAGFVPLRTEMPMNCRASLPGRSWTPAVQKDIDRITSIWRTCRQQFGQGGDWLFRSFTIADAMFAPVVLRFRTYGVTLDPVCQAYAETILSLPALQSWLSDAQAEPEILPQFERG
jgi:glutathione S-transferase